MSGPQISPSYTVSEYETILNQALTKCNKLSKTDLMTSTNNSDTAQEIAIAKMLNYCIRMLHADGWHPPTILRAMALREAGLERGMRGTMYQALRERRKEIEIYKLQKAMIPEGARGYVRGNSSTPQPLSNSNGSSSQASPETNGQRNLQNGIHHPAAQEQGRQVNGDEGHLTGVAAAQRQ